MISRASWLAVSGKVQLGEGKKATFVGDPGSPSENWYWNLLPRKLRWNPKNSHVNEKEKSSEPNPHFWVPCLSFRGVNTLILC